MFGFSSREKANRDTTTKNLLPEDTTLAEPSAAYKSVGPSPRYVIEDLPQGTIIKKIFTRQSKNLNKWRVSYHGSKKFYYGHTLEVALQEFFKNNPRYLGRYLDNNEGSRGSLEQ